MPTLGLHYTTQETIGEMIYLTIKQVLADSAQPMTVAAIAKRMHTHRQDVIRNAMRRHPNIFCCVGTQHIPHQHGIANLWALVPEPEPKPEPVDTQRLILLEQAGKVQTLGLAIRCLAQVGEGELALMVGRKFYRESDKLNRMCNHAIYAKEN